MLTIFTLAQCLGRLLDHPGLPSGGKIFRQPGSSCKTCPWLVFCHVFFGLHSFFTVPHDYTSGILSRNFQCEKASPWLSNFFLILILKIGRTSKKHPVPIGWMNPKMWKVVFLRDLPCCGLPRDDWSLGGLGSPLGEDSVDGHLLLRCGDSTI